MAKECITMRDKKHLFDALNWLDGFSQSTIVYQPEVSIYRSYDLERMTLYFSITSVRDTHNLFDVIKGHLQRINNRR